MPGRYWVGYEPSVQASTDGEPVRLVVARNRGMSIAGVVVDPRGHRVPGAIVSTGESEGMSDHAGRFRIDGLAPGSYELVVRPQETGIATGPCFEPTTVPGVSAGRDDVVARVGEGRVVRGTILDEDGAAVAGAEVTLLPPRPPDGPGVDPRPHTPAARTDGDGRYELRSVGDGPVELAVFCDGYLPAVFTARRDEAATQRLARGASIAGVLLDADGAPAPGRTLRCSLEKVAKEADVAPWRRNWEMYGPEFDVRTGGDGRFRFTGLPAGEYRLEHGRSLAPVRVPTGTTDVELRLLPLLTITGVVVGPDGRPVCRSGHKRLRISADHESGQVGYVPLAEDGSFRFARVPQGRIRLHVIGWTDFESAEMHVEAGAQDVRVQMRPSRHR